MSGSTSAYRCPASAPRCPLVAIRSARTLRGDADRRLMVSMGRTGRYGSPTGLRIAGGGRNLACAFSRNDPLLGVPAQPERGAERAGQPTRELRRGWADSDAGLLSASRVREYMLTEKGRDRQPVLLTLIAWGAGWAAPDAPPVLLAHDRCGGAVHSRLRCAHCGPLSDAETITAGPGPGSPRLEGDHGQLALSPSQYALPCVP